MKKNIIILNSHPIQYFAPLYRELAKEEDISLTVYYCSDFSIKGNVDKQFGQMVKWDIPLLDGYKSVFLKNYSLSPSIYSFWGLLNWGIIKILFNAPKNSIVVVHGWAYFINILTLIFAKILGLKTAIRGDTSFIIEMRKLNASSLLKRKLRRFTLYSLFKFVDFAFFVGKTNRQFYEFYGMKEKNLIYTPYAVDNDFFDFYFTNNNKQDIRDSLGILPNTICIIASGKFRKLKRLGDLIHAFESLSTTKQLTLLLVGDGEERENIENYIKEKKITNVFITGFINQSSIWKYYLCADIYVMCSDTEMWGLSTNEAMNFELPIVLSDHVGCAVDLVQHGENGFIYPVGNIEQLTDCLNLLVNNDSFRLSAGKKSKKIIANYSFEQTIRVFKCL